MTPVAVSLLIGGIAGYVGFLALVLALLSAAKRADEDAEQDARVLGARSSRLAHPNGELRDRGFTAADEVQFGCSLDRPAAVRRVQELDAVPPGPLRAEQEGSESHGRNMG